LGVEMWEITFIMDEETVSMVVSGLFLERSLKALADKGAKIINLEKLPWIE